MLDVVIQAYGTLEAGMHFTSLNGKNISDVPSAGDEFQLKNTGVTDAAVLKYIGQNGITIGTLDSQPEVRFDIILKPVMTVVPSTTSPPHITVHYQFDWQKAPGFVNLYPIPHAHYPANDNMMWHVTEERYLAHETPDSSLCSGYFMDDGILPYTIGWVAGRGLMMIWSDLTAPVKSATFVDSKGHEAFCAPVILLSNVAQNVLEYLIADISADIVSATGTAVTLRLTRRHSPIGLLDFVTHSMSWMYDATSGYPDPLDPGNTDKTILVLTRGTYKFGVATVYTNAGTAYPPSAFSMVVEIT
jgi:hypothetical protein